ncbi:DUF6332 family protein [Kitasatospora sp. NPDC058965]|uniref:DUF6332 family protein n=1 Tax=Kitasatospora sp. NPDC058965 TaxID=3346682 RepID=UPI003678DFA6
MDTGREVRWDKDAMTVEIVFALVTGALVAAAVFALALVPALVLLGPGPARSTVLLGGALAGVTAGGWRAARVLVRFDAHRRQGT